MGTGSMGIWPGEAFPGLGVLQVAVSSMVGALPSHMENPLHWLPYGESDSTQREAYEHSGIP
jgi:hypothetical protein